MYIKACALLTVATLVISAGAEARQAEVELVVASGVTDREPVGASNNFPADVGEVTAWTRVTGAANSTIEHVWRHGDLEFVVTLNIGGSPWRTWSTKNIPAEWAGE